MPIFYMPNTAGRPAPPPAAQLPNGETRLPALIALLAVGGLFYFLPPALRVGPSWLVPALVTALIVPAALFRRRNPRANQILSYSALSVATAAMVASLVLLVSRLPLHKEKPVQLLLSATGLWLCNTVIFASWYWRLDAGGPNKRDLRESHTDGAFLFPQMTLSPQLRKEMGEDQWRPGFVDYLFLSFNTSTAFSPTDVLILSRWAKVLMMVQSLISLSTIAILAARAINIL